jgi:hypothetical protein
MAKKTKGTTFVDYTFTLLPNGDLKFDKELDGSALDLKPGDKLEVQTLEGTKSIVLKKRDYRSRNHSPFIKFPFH